METVVDNISALLARLQSPDFYEREEAVKELSTHSEDEAVAGLVLALEDPDLGIRELAADHVARIKGPLASHLLIQFLGNDDIGSRNLASEILVKIGEEAVEPLVSELNNDDHDVRKFIVDILGLIKSKQASEPLSQKLWDENSNVICSAAESLGAIGSPESVPHLIAAFEKVKDVQLQAVEALGKIGDPAALPKLKEFLKAGDPIISYAVIEAIGQIGSKESVADISEYLKQPDRLLAEAAMTAIVRINMKHDGKIDFDLPLDEFRDFLFDGIRNRDEEITEFTLTRLGRWYGNDVISGLLDVIDYVEDSRLKQITDIISEIGPAAGRFIIEKLKTAPTPLKLRLLGLVKEFVDPELGAELIGMIDDADTVVRQKVAHVLGASGNPACVEPLKKLTADPDGHVRAAAFSALGWIATQDDAAFIFEGLDDRYPDVREAAVGALIIVGGEAVVKKFTEDLYHEDTERQCLAVTALGWIGELETVDPLLKAVNHHDPTVRRSAINSLTRIGEVPDVAPIVTALNDENVAVRKAAVTALISLRGKGAVADIRFLLDDEDVWVQYHTITMIGDLRQGEYSTLIVPFLRHDHDIIKIAAMKALSSMGTREAIPALEQLCSVKNKDVAEAAQSALGKFGGRG